MKIRLRLLGAVSGDAPVIESANVFEASVHSSRSLLIGRHRNCDLRLEDATVGQRVVELRATTGGVSVRDLGSGGGSFIRRGAVTIDRPECLISSGDQLGIGRLLFDVEINEH